jgi:hypothetical protein
VLSLEGEDDLRIGNRSGQAESQLQTSTGKQSQPSVKQELVCQRGDTGEGISAGAAKQVTGKS